jgi:integration host factor subunit beta
VRQPATTSLTKRQLVVEISRVLELPLKEAHGILDAILESMVRALQSGGKVEIRGFGSFNIRVRGARIGRNPKTGAKVAVPAKRILYFALSKDLKTLLYAHAVARKQSRRKPLGLKERRPPSRWPTIRREKSHPPAIVEAGGSRGASLLHVAVCKTTIEHKSAK